MFDNNHRVCVCYHSIFEEHSKSAGVTRESRAGARCVRETSRSSEQPRCMQAGVASWRAGRCQALAERLQPREKLFTQDQTSEPYSTCCTWVLFLQYMRRPDGASYRRHGSETHQHQTSPKRPTRLWHAGSSQVRAILLCERSAACD